MKKLIFSISFLMLSMLANAANEDYKNTISCADIFTGNVFQVSDPLFSLSNSTWDDSVSYQQVENQISLNFDQFTQEYLNNGWIQLSLKVTYWDENQVSHQFNKKLRVDYSNNAGDLHNTENKFVFQGGHKVHVEILGISTSSGFTTLPCGIQLNAEVKVERYYAFSSKKNCTPAHSLHASSNRLIVNWPMVNGAETFELEWLFVDNYNNSGTLAASALNYNFNTSATRVEVNSVSYEIPLVFESGYLLYRVRPIGVHNNNHQVKVWGTWSEVSEGLVSTINEKYLVSPHEGDMINWSYKAVFGDNGIQKNGVSYFDGTSRKRQSVVRNNTIEQSMVGETYYDQHGRAAVYSLPAPAFEDYLKYFSAFNMHHDSAYHFSHFAVNTGDSCGISALPFDYSSGAGLYYSSENPDQDKQQAYVPEASGYAFRQIEYTPDMASRIAKEGKFGAAHQLGSGHEVEYEYSTPLQQDVDKLFGTNIGYENFYRVITIKDENGQFYRNYLDPYERTIATSLTGNGPESLQNLPENTGAIKDTTIFYGDVQPIGELAYLPNGLRRIKEISVKAQGHHSFYLNRTLNFYSDSCLPEGFCFDCVYDLTIKIVDDCGNDVTDGFSRILGPETLNTSCGTDSFFLDSIKVYLIPGKYYFEELLTVNDSARQFYLNQFLENNLCLPTYQDILQQIIDSIDFTMCNPYEDSISDNPCSALYLAMYNDFWPGGQYAEFFNTDSGKVAPSTFPLSIFNLNNNLPSNLNWTDINFTDKNGRPDSIFVGSVLTPINLAPVDLVLSSWKPSYTDSLVKLHPEYCYFMGCIRDSLSHNFDNLLLSIDSFKHAYDSGFFNLLGMPPGTTIDDTLVPYHMINMGVIDPFFQFGGNGYSYLQDFRDSLRNFLTIDGNNYTIWQIAMLVANCNEVDLPASKIDSCIGDGFYFNQNYIPGTLCNENEVWENFRALYLNLKQIFYDKVLTTYAINNKCYNGCIGVAIFNQSLNGFSSAGGYTDPDQPCNSTTYLYYQNKFPRWNTSSIPFSDWLGKDVEPYLDSLTSISDSMCTVICETKVDMWMNALKNGCTSFIGDSAAIRNAFLEICQMGCDSGIVTGTSSTPPGVVTSSGFSSFQDVLEHFSITIDSTCNPFLLGNVHPYGYDPLGKTPWLDTCACDKILFYKNQYESATNLPPNITSFEEYFLFTHGEAYPDIDYSVCDCENIFEAATAQSWTPGATWPESAAIMLTENPQGTLPSLTCSNCINCETFDEHVASFHALIENLDTATTNYHFLLANYLKQQTGFNLNQWDVRAFMRQCNNSTDTCSYLSAQAFDLLNVLNELAQSGNFDAPISSGMISLNNYPTYTLSNLSTYFQGNNYFTCHTGFSQTCNDSVLTFNFGISDDYCEFEAFKKNPLPFNQITGFVAIYPMTSASVLQYDFKLLAAFVDQTGQTVYDTLWVTSVDDCLPINACNNEIKLCDKPIIFPVDKTDNCREMLLAQAQARAKYIYAQIIDSVSNKFIADYTSKCLENLENDFVEFVFWDHEYNFTLYHYDRAGNLVKTIPPKGIDHDFNFSSVPTNRADNLVDVPDHTLATRYNYNSINQTTQIFMPDEGTTRYWYDAAQRLVASQNAKQKAMGRYSYTLFDNSGRTYEFGELAYETDTLTNVKAASQAQFLAWVTASNRYEITRTYFDEPLTNNISNQFNEGQTNLRLNIATIAYYTQFQDVDTNYTRAVHYSYDELGNVKEVIHDYPELKSINYRFFATRYQYEWLTGNVTKILYNAGRPDQFYHQYAYDADNRLIAVNTSTNDKIWQTDAKYFYYNHGPLARVELGDAQIQGVDFIYTINGWLKGMNSPSLFTHRDPGSDAYSDSPQYGTRNQNFAPDVVGWNLTYFNGEEDGNENDYQSITNFDEEHYFLPQQTGDFTTATPNLYDGNISNLALGIKDFDFMGYAFKYDQLKRLVKRRSFSKDNFEENNWSDVSETQNYYVKIGYDPNGNIDSLLRYAYDGHQLEMDDFAYHYANANQLDFVEDIASDNAAYDDIKQGMSAQNYKYNQIGQLTADVSEGIDTILYDAYHRIAAIFYDFEVIPQIIYFEYDANGHRMKKTVYTKELTTTTYYVNDVDGNTQAIYTLINGNQTCQCEEEPDPTCMRYAFMLDELPIYGAGREGVYAPNVLLFDSAVTSGCTIKGTWYINSDSLLLTLGKKQYELKGHTGNIYATVSDRKLQIAGTGGHHAGYVADVLFKADYYPFGMVEPGRNENATAYRYAFDGFEADNEVAGNGNSYTTYFRQYDPRLGRWKTPDPVIHAWESPYAGFANNPILYVDPAGDEPITATIVAVTSAIAKAAATVGPVLQKIGVALKSFFISYKPVYTASARTLSVTTKLVPTINWANIGISVGSIAYLTNAASNVSDNPTLNPSTTPDKPEMEGNGNSNSDKNFTTGFEKCKGCGTKKNPVELKVFEVVESKPLPIDEITSAAMALTIAPEAISTIGGLILLSGVGLYIIIQQFDDPFPGPFYTERPTDYIPNEFNKNNYNSPPPNWEDFLGVVFVTGVSYYLIKDRLERHTNWHPPLKIPNTDSINVPNPVKIPYR